MLAINESVCSNLIIQSDNSNYIGQYKHTPVVAILFVSIVEKMVVNTIFVLIPIYIRSENSITHHINILIITVTRGKSFAPSVLSTELIVEGAGESTLELICKLSGPLSLCWYNRS